MNIFDTFIKLIEGYLENHDTVSGVIKKIKAKVGTGRGRIAFFPCSRYANILIREIKDKEPGLFVKIEGIYDKSREATSDTGIPVYHLSEVTDKINECSLIVICSNTYHEREVWVLREETGYTGDILCTSYFDISLPTKSKERILGDIKTVYDMLADEKSKAVYMITWLSKALNDETCTYLFESEQNIEINGQETKYKEYTIKGLGNVCATELYAEIYRMRHVYPVEGDTVLDIGGYKGDSAIFFADAVGRKGKVFVFEPTSSNFNVLLDNIKYNNLLNVIIPINKGLSNKKGFMRVTSVDSGAPWSFISDDNGNEEVAVTTIDEFVASEGIKKVDFIKMDVEGLEYQVISGGRKTIQEMKPKLAVPLYHKFCDLTELPLLVNEIADYKFYMRCKVEGPFGITMYCTKKNNLL